jgi:MFS family permease
VLFLVHGFVVGSWVSRIPAVQSAVRVDNGILGLVFLSSALGAICAIPVSGTLVSRFGSKSICVGSTVAFCLAMAPLGIARHPLSLAAALFVFGATAATMDVAMNAQGVEVEKLLRHPTMSRFHGMFSLGAMAGAACGGWVASRGIAPATHFATVALLDLAAALAITSWLIDSLPAATRSAGFKLAKIPRVLVALSIIGFCILLTEGAMADWTAIYLRHDLNAGPGLAAQGYSVFSAAMATCRLLGDVITARLGPVKAVRTGAALAALGIGWSLSVHSPEWALPGFAAAGAGLSIIIPLVFGSGGRIESIDPGIGIATVTGIGYLGFLAGPPTIGLTSRVFTLHHSLILVIVCCVTASLLSRYIGETGARVYAGPEPHV